MQTVPMDDIVQDGIERDERERKNMTLIEGPSFDERPGYIKYTIKMKDKREPVTFCVRPIPLMYGSDGPVMYDPLEHSNLNERAFGGMSYKSLNGDCVYVAPKQVDDFAMRNYESLTKSLKKSLTKPTKATNLILHLSI